MTDNSDEKSSVDGKLPNRTQNIFFLLSRRRRRAVVYTVAMSPRNQVSLRQLAEIICSLEADAEQDSVPTRQVTNVRTNLKRSHLPPLEDGGVITRESNDSDLLRPGPAFGETLSVLGAGEHNSNDIDWFDAFSTSDGGLQTTDCSPSTPDWHR